MQCLGVNVELLSINDDLSEVLLRGACHFDQASMNEYKFERQSMQMVVSIILCCTLLNRL